MSGLIAVVLGFGFAWWQQGSEVAMPEIGGTANRVAQTSGPAGGTGVRPVAAGEASEAAASNNGGSDAVTALQPQTSSFPVPPPTSQAQSASAAVAGGNSDALSGARATAEELLSLPTLSELTADGLALPSLRLELLVYHNVAASRMVFINGARYRQGERIKEGPEVIEIRSDAVVLSNGERRFLLLPQ
jgi:hypothetical protein